MAKTSKLAMNKRRQKLAKKHLEKREALRKIVKDPNSSFEQQQEAMMALQALPRNSSPNRVRNRCEVTGRPRAFYRDFKMSRIALRDHGLRGEIPGLTKASW
ncbi:MAG: 30S ribosomal protein S14 [Myxococcota bacterium]